MALQNTFQIITAEELLPLSHEMKAGGARFVQVLAVNTEEGIDLIYSFMKDKVLCNYTIKGIHKDQQIPSITDDFFAAFVFENEAHDLFGVQITGIAIDFQGNFYDLAIREPMTVISPAQKEAREKAAKIAAAKAAKEAQGGAEKPKTLEEEIAEKTAGLDPEKAEKVRAGMIAKAKKKAIQEMEEKLAGMDPDKAAKLRVAMERKIEAIGNTGKAGE